MKMKTSEQMLQTTQEFLQQEGLLQNQTEQDDRIDLLLETLAKSRNAQSAFYSWQPAQGGNPLRKIKNFILLKIKSIILNALEKYAMRQQKYNEVVYQTILELAAENKQLKAQLEEHGTTN